MFKSGVNAGGGLTYELDEQQNKNGHFLDTPGLADEVLRKKAGEAISEGLRKGGSYKVIFFVTQESGRVNQQDATTLNLVLDAAVEIGMDYGIIVNKVPKRILKLFEDEAKKIDFLNSLFAGIPEERKCVYSNVRFFGRMSSLADKDDTIISPTELKDDSDVTLLDFVDKIVPKIKITETRVTEIKTDMFEEMKNQMESMARQLQEKDEQWKEERRQLEVQRIKDHALLAQGNKIGKFVGDDLFQNAKEYIDGQNSRGGGRVTSSCTKGIIIENVSSYDLLYKDSKFICGDPLFEFDDLLFDNKCIHPKTAIAQFSIGRKGK